MAYVVGKVEVMGHTYVLPLFLCQPEYSSDIAREGRNALVVVRNLDGDVVTIVHHCVDWVSDALQKVDIIALSGEPGPHITGNRELSENDEFNIDSVLMAML